MAGSTLFCPMFYEKKHQLLRRGTGTSPCVTRTYTCVDFLEFASPLGGAIIDDRTPVLINQFSRAQDNRRSERDAINRAAHGDLTVRWMMT